MSKLAQDAQKRTQLSNEVGAQSSELRMKCNAVTIHHATIHQIIINTFASQNNTSHNNNTAGARSIACSRVKWLQPVMKGSSCVRRLRLGPFQRVIGSSRVFCNVRLFMRAYVKAVLESVVADRSVMAA